jgi:flagellar basal body-associated protein FliL
MDQPMKGSTGLGKEGKSSKKVLWIVLGLLLFLCVCGTIGAGVWLWNNGDQLLEGIGRLFSSAVFV